MKHCPNCHRPLIEIDHYGERLIGCIECNRWTWPGDDTSAARSLEITFPSPLANLCKKLAQTHIA
jgi:hypothetical protein